MAIVRPFKGLIYNLEKIDDIGKVVCPPYDVISPEEQEYFYNLSPFNIIRVELGKNTEHDDETNNVYTRARSYLEDWISKEILLFEDKPYFYIYAQEFLYEGKRYLRPGIVAAVKIEDYETRTILPHEKTLPKAKEDRLNLLRETHSNISQIFSFFSDTTRKARLVINEILKKQNPVFSFTDDKGVLHSLYRVEESYETDIFDALYDAQLFIADGHHRYETALKFRNEMRAAYGEIEDAWYEYVLMTLVPVESDLLILPIHRIVILEEPVQEKDLIDRLSVWFNVKPVPGSEHLKQELDSSTSVGVMGMITPSNLYILKPKEESLKILDKNIPEEIRFLDASIFNELVLKNVLDINLSELERRVKFTSDYREIVETPKKHKNRVSFALRSVPVEAVKKIALKGLTMPQKTTYFYPKLWTGLVMRCNLKV